MMNIDKKLLLTLVTKMTGRVKYRLGGKAPGLNCDSNLITHLDCSGFVRYLLLRTARVDIKDGSSVQWDEIKRQGYKRSTYDAHGAGRMDGRVRIAFMRAYRGGYGHVWLIHDGRTIESYGNVGVGRRPWNTKILADRCEGVYVLSD